MFQFKFFTQMYFNYPCNAWLGHENHTQPEVQSQKTLWSSTKKPHLLMQFEDVTVVSYKKYYALYQYIVVSTSLSR